MSMTESIDRYYSFMEKKTAQYLVADQVAER